VSNLSDNMSYTVAKDQLGPEDWRVEALSEGEGDGFVVIFTGSKAQQLAEEYAAWKRAQIVPISIEEVDMLIANNKKLLDKCEAYLASISKDSE